MTLASEGSRGVPLRVMEKVDLSSHREPGEILRDLRKVLAPEGARKMSQAELAERLGYDEGYLQSMETGRRPLQPHLVDRLAKLDDETRFPDAFARLIEELRASVAAYWAAEAARPPVIGGPPGDNPGTAGALTGSVAGKLEGKLDALQGAVEGLSAKAEGRLDGLGGKLDRTEGTLAVLGNRLETASGRTEAALGALGGKVDDTSRRTEAALDALGGKVDDASGRTEGQLSAVAANVAGAHEKLDRSDAKVESVRTQVAQAEKKVTRKLDMLIRLLCANFVGVTALFILHCHRAPSAIQTIQPAQGGTASVGVAQGAAEARVKDRCVESPTPPCLHVLGAEPWVHLGKAAPPEKWLAPEPLEGQKLPPCDDGLGEKALNGGCWIRVDDVKPPCGRLFRKGDSCYIPIAANPKQPVGEAPRQATPERPFQQ